MKEGVTVNVRLSKEKKNYRSIFIPMRYYDTFPWNIQ